MVRLSILMTSLLTAIGAIALGFGSAADAAVTNCMKATGGDFGWSYCSGRTANPPYTTQHVVQVKCTRPWYDGGGSYYATGNWANVGSYSTVECAWNYLASAPIILFR